MRFSFLHNLVCCVAISISSAYAQAPAVSTPADPAEIPPVNAAPSNIEATVNAASATSPTSATTTESTNVADPAFPYKSFMYSQEEIAAQQPLIEKFKLIQENPQLASASISSPTIPQAAPVQFYTYPQFYLDSIVYYHPKLWTAWVNGKRYTQDSATEGQELAITSISPKMASFIWMPSKKERFEWKPARSSAIAIDASARQITFSLHPNQTFSTYRMQIIEGRVKPAIIDLNQTPGAPKKPTTPAAEISTPSAPTTPAANDSKDTGLGGLIDRYQNINKD